MRRLVLLVVLAAAAGGLSSCGEEEATAAERIRSAPSATAEAGSAQVEMTMSGPGFEVESEGTMALDEERGTMTMDFGGLSIELVFDGLVSYQRSELFGDLPGDAEWVRVDAAALNEAQSGVDLEQVQQTSNNPADMLASLEAVSEDGVEEVGDEEVRGEDATHYRASIDIVQAIEDADAVTDQEQFEAFAEVYGDEPLDVDVWLDGEGRAVRQDMGMEIQGQELDIRVELFDFGTDVDVEVPADGEWVDITELLPES
jgi:hypothetical protein